MGGHLRCPCPGWESRCCSGTVRAPSGPRSRAQVSRGRPGGAGGGGSAETRVSLSSRRSASGGPRSELWAGGLPAFRPCLWWWESRISSLRRASSTITPKPRSCAGPAAPARSPLPRLQTVPLRDLALAGGQEPGRGRRPTADPGAESRPLGGARRGWCQHAGGGKGGRGAGLWAELTLSHSGRTCP